MLCFIHLLSMDAAKSLPVKSLKRPLHSAPPGRGGYCQQPPGPDLPLSGHPVSWLGMFLPPDCMVTATCTHSLISMHWHDQLHTVPNVNIVAKIMNYFRKTIITTVITVDTQCRIVVTNRSYDRDDS